MKTNSFLLLIFGICYCCTEKSEFESISNGINESCLSLKTTSDLPWTAEVLFDGSISYVDYTNLWCQYHGSNSPFPVLYNDCSNNATAKLLSNVYIESNTLIIKGKKEPSNGYNYENNIYSNYKYSRGQLRTKKVDHFKYGYYEVDFKFTKSYGFGPNLWLRHEGEDPLVEIDIFEFEAWNPRLVPCGYYYDIDGDWVTEVFGTTQITSTNFKNMPDFSKSFNKIGFEWTPTYMAWYINNQLAKKLTSSDGPIPNVPMDIILDVNFPRAGACPNSSTPLNNYYEVKSFKYFSERPVNALFLSANNGNIITIKDFVDWKDSWSIAVPGDFDSDNITDILLYDRTNGIGVYYNSKDIDPHTYTGWRQTWKTILSGNIDNTGNSDLVFYDELNDEIYALGITSPFPGDWDIIIPCKYNSDKLTDLLVYRKVDGLAKYFSINQNGTNLLSTMSGWRKTWDIIVAGNFAEGSSYGWGESEYCLYDRTNNEIQINGIIIPQSAYYKWDYIVSGKFDSDKIDDIMCYDRETGTARFYKVSSNGLSILKTYYNWRKTWNILISGNFDNAGNDDIFLYDN